MAAHSPLSTRTLARTSRSQTPSDHATHAESSRRRHPAEELQAPPPTAASLFPSRRAPGAATHSCLPLPQPKSSRRRHPAASPLQIRNPSRARSRKTSLVRRQKIRNQAVAELDRTFSFVATGLLLSAPAPASSLSTPAQPPLSVPASSLSLCFSSLSSTVQSSSSSLGRIQSRPSCMDTRIWAKVSGLK
jgi:hypothetical protein